MGTLQRYILRQFVAPFGFFVLVLTSVVWLTQSLRVIDVIIKNGQGAGVFFEFAVLLLPVVFAIVLQLSALAAVVYGLNRLMSDSELSAALASGVSRLQAARPVILFGVAAMLLLAFNILYLMPTSSSILKTRTAEVRGDLVAGFLREGEPFYPAKNFRVEVNEIAAGGVLKGITIRDGRAEGRPIIYTGQEARIDMIGGAPHLILENGTLQRPGVISGLEPISQFDEVIYDLSPLMRQVGERRRRPSEHFFWELIWPEEQIEPGSRTYNRFVTEGHEQLSAPLYGLSLPLLAAAILLSSGYSRYGATTAIGIAVVTAAGTRVLGMVFKGVVEATPEVWFLLYAPPALSILFAFYLLTRTRLPRRRKGPPAAAQVREAPGE